MKKILIIGNSAKVYALAKKMSETSEVYVIPGNPLMEEFAKTADIRENSVSEILEFVMENGIDMTIPCSTGSMKTDITEAMEKHNLSVFSPSKNAAAAILDKAAVKKMLYKLRVPTPKFGIFEKQAMVADYVKNLRGPFVIKTNEPSSAVVFSSNKTAKGVIDSIFAKNSQKVLIEDYVWGTPFNFYAITDGYKALPIGSSLVYKYALEGDGGQLTSGMGACVPNYKLSFENEYYLMDNVVYPILEYFNAQGNAYTGILGISGIIEENGNLQVLGCDTFFQDSDADAIMEQIDTDIYSLFESCVLGSFSDEIDRIPQKDKSAVSLVLNCNYRDSVDNPISGIDELSEDIKCSFYPSVRKNKYMEYSASYGPVAVITAFAGNISKASAKIYDEVEGIKFNGMYYRKDICKPLLSVL